MATMVSTPPMISTRTSYSSSSTIKINFSIHLNGAILVKITVATLELMDQVVLDVLTQETAGAEMGAPVTRAATVGKPQRTTLTPSSPFCTNSTRKPTRTTTTP